MTARVAMFWLKYGPVLARLVGAVLIFASVTAAAQTALQPIYIRPAKGKSITVFSAVAAAPTTSSVYDWQAFDSATLYVTCSALCTSGQILVQGSNSATGTFSTLSNDDNANRTFTAADISPLAYSVSGLPPYVRFVINALPGAGTLSVTVVPIPFNTRMDASGPYAVGATVPSSSHPVLVGGVDSLLAARVLRLSGAGGISLGATRTGIVSTAVTVDGVGPDQVHTSSASVCSVTLVNTDTNVVFCSQTNTVTAAAGMPLNAAAVAGAAGGSYTFDNYGGDLFCTTAAAITTTVVRVQPTACP